MKIFRYNIGFLPKQRSSLIFVILVIFLFTAYIPANEKSKKRPLKQLFVPADREYILASKIPTISNDIAYKWMYPTPTSGGGTDLLEPAIGIDGSIYCGNPYSGLYALTPKGELSWQRSVTGYGSICVALDGTIYLSLGSGIYSFYPNGKDKWFFLVDEHISTMGAIGNDGTIYFGCNDNNMYSVNPFGELNWKFPTKGNVVSSPAIGPGGILYFGSEDGYFYALYPDGVPKWMFNTFDSIGCPEYWPVWGDPAISKDGTIYVSSWKYRYAFNPNGTLKWKSSYSAYWGKYFAIGPRGIIYLDVIGKLFALDPATGFNKWEYTPNAWWGGALSIGLDGTIYFGSGTQDFNTCMHAVTPEGRLKWDLSFRGSYNMSCPVIDEEGTIYFGYGGGFYAADCDSFGLASSTWPKWKHDNMNSSSFDFSLKKPFPPLNFVGVKKENRSVLAHEYINILTWEKNYISEEDTAKYRIYEIDKQSRTILIEPDKDILEYYHRGVEKDKKYYYAIRSVDSFGNEGPLSYCRVD
jgi:outer membrane protein assembly factor BamB